ncbi:MAG: NAD-dependent epimerase/dehydratase family protein [Candidatus Kapabacteria bacterium]|nr:NAD-dependent epimerase/dehydratase family protein [Candidatus Kapabacteria bacterium]MDW7996765.1 NAD-dependent epimerase/dehydratase family protein [Bacteroidota bacterium]
MRALVTGATGFIGSHLVDALLAQGVEVRCLVRRQSNRRWLSGKPVELVEASLSDPESLSVAVKGIDVVYHVAGLIAARSYEEFLRGNRDATAHLIEAVLRWAPNLQRFVFLSSLAAVGPARSLMEPVTEDTPYHPVTAYGKSKQAAEEVLLSIMDKLPITIIRPPAVYGPRDAATLPFFRSVRLGIAPLVGFREKYLSLVHVSDLVRGILLAASAPHATGRLYCISSEEFYTWMQLTEAARVAIGRRRIWRLRVPHTLVMGIASIAEVAGWFMQRPPVFDFEKGRDILQPYWICSPERAQKELGYRQSVSLVEGMRETVAWYYEHGWL